MCPFLQTSVNKADCFTCASIAMAGKKIKLDEEAMGEILVADTESE
jgi:hypothetical protein